jgi:hypothetical protein
MGPQVLHRGDARRSANRGAYGLAPAPHSLTSLRVRGTGRSLTCLQLFYTSRAYHLWGKSPIVLYTLVILMYVRARAHLSSSSSPRPSPLLLG